MIRNFSDHAANERTFLAWIRTALAIIAFGFVIERFDFFIAGSLASGPHHTNGMGAWAGTLSVGLGLFMVLLSMVRFIRTSKDIDSREERPSPDFRYDGMLAALVVVMGSTSLLYLSHATASMR